MWFPVIPDGCIVTNTIGGEDPGIGGSFDCARYPGFRVVASYQLQAPRSLITQERP